MAATNKGVWDIQDVRDKQLASEWSYTSEDDPGALYTWGYNPKGQLGHNDRTQRSSPTQIPGSWSVVSVWQNETAGIKEDGTLWTWGENSTFGQLGHNDRIRRSSPTQVGTNTNWANVLINDEFCVGVKTDGTLWAWGYNSRNIRGSGLNYRSSPVQIPGTWPTELGKMAHGPGGSIGSIKTDGTLWMWGRNTSGMAGHNNTTQYSSPKQVGTNTNWKTFGKNGIIQINTKALKTDGTLWTWGRNNSGEAGLNYITTPSDNGISSPTQIPGTIWGDYFTGTIAAGHTKTDGTLWYWSKAYSGSFGINVGGDFKRSSPTQVGTDAVWFGISGSESMLGTKTDGTLWAWGSNAGGQAAQNSTNPGYSSPVQIPGTTWMKNSMRAIGYNMAARKFV
tara:strand:- start:88 stop:1266 length:1179 start_codon:yes stop_codon:yes gene_type:complete